jgi:sulfur-oxidizing protein SoxA
MRFRSSIALLVLAAVPFAASATPEESKAQVAARLAQQLPSLSRDDYATGSAALDETLRAQVEQNAASGAALVEAGKKIWNAKFKDGRTLAGCFPNGGRRVAASYPLWDARVKRVVTLEIAINQCRKAHGEALFDIDGDTMATALAYARSLSNGQRLAVRVPAAAQASFERGRRMYFTRMGQRNFACASCHVQGAGKRYDERMLSPAIGQATHWPENREGVPVTMQARIRECLERMGAAPFAAGSDELNELEYYLSYLSNGLPLTANAWRPKS